MPKHITELVTKALSEAGKKPAGAKIAVLGTAYKGDVNNSRLSPAKDIIEGIFMAHGPDIKKGYKLDSMPKRGI